MPTRRSESSVRDASKRWETWVVPFMGQIEVGKLTPGHVREYRLFLEGAKGRSGTPFKPETIRHFLRAGVLLLA